MTTAAQWLGEFASELGIEPPTEAEYAAILSLASTAAHASERPAAPVACWLAARAGLTPEDALSLAARISDPPTA